MGESEYTNIEVIVFEGENGENIEMSIIDEFNHEGGHYIALADANVPDDTEDAVSFFKIQEGEEEDVYELVEDDALLETLRDLMEKRLLAGIK